MKQIFGIILVIAICSFCLSACFSAETVSRADEYDDFDQYDKVYYKDLYNRFSTFSKSAIYLNTEKETFCFRLSPIASYLPYGHYYYQDDISALVLQTDDGINTYAFKMSGDDLVFDSENSNGATYDSFEDGDVFARQTHVQEFYDAYGSIDADIDGDGVSEHCSMGYGPTSGLFTFTFSASVNGDGKYFHIFNTDFYYLSFLEADGKALVCGETKEGITHYFDISVEDGTIVLSEDGVHLGHWGAQGLN